MFAAADRNSSAKRDRPRGRGPRPAGGRQEASSSAYARLRELVVTGRLAPGAPLIETDLSKRMGMSRTPVRAALQRLQQEGFVASVCVGQMARAVVAPLTAEDMREVFVMTGALEATAARLAAALDAEARDTLARDMAAVNVGLREATAARPPDLVQAQELHARFHRTFSTAAAGRRLLAELDVLQPQAERYQRVYTSAMVFAYEDALEEHDAIIAALRAGDANAAEEAVSRNWRGGAERYRQVVTILGERGNW